MAGHAWFAPEERRIILNSLIAGNDWATASHLVIGTDPSQVDDTFADTQQSILEAEAAKALAAQFGGPASQAAYYAALVTPTFTSITPATGDAGGGETCTIVGTGFMQGATVKLGAGTATHAQTVLSINPTTIKIKTVAHAAEAACHILITNPSTKEIEGADAWAFTAAATPTFTSITPATGPKSGGTVCKIVGTNFKEGFSVLFGTKPALVQSWTATTAVVVAPWASAGAVGITITNPSTTTVTGAAAYTYT